MLPFFRCVVASSFLFIVLALALPGCGDDSIQSKKDPVQDWDVPDKILIKGKFLSPPEAGSIDFGESKMESLSGRFQPQAASDIQPRLGFLKYHQARSRELHSPARGQCDLTQTGISLSADGKEMSFQFWGWESGSGPRDCGPLMNGIKEQGFELILKGVPTFYGDSVQELTIRVQP